MKFVYALFFILIVHSARGQDEAYIYSEEEGEGPFFWGKTHPLCNGRKQSPINVETSNLDRSSNETIQFDGYDVAPEEMLMVNTGHSLEIELTGNITMFGGGLGGAEYQAAQLNFHWGRFNHRGSEHQVDHHEFPLEMHIVSYNTKYNATDAVNHEDGLSILTVLFELSEEDNPTLQSFLQFTKQIKFPGDHKSLEPFPIDQLFPANATDASFYQYQGSLTTPPCTENVLWNIFVERSFVSKFEMRELRRLHAVNEERMGDNFRFLQNLNGRQVALI